MITQVNAILAFFFIIFGFGYSLFFLTNATKQKNLIVHILELAAVGLAIFSFFGIIFGLLNIPLHLVVYLILATICPVIGLIKNAKTKMKFTWSPEETTCAAITIGIMVVLTSIYAHGAFSYGWLENDDPWNHAQAATYIAREHTYDIDLEARTINGGYAFYLEPYPPTYDIIMGIMRQANESISWTLKFFNALLCGLAIGFIYLFVKQLLKSDLKALFAALTIAALPSFMSHFIWSQTLAVALFPVGMYAVLKSLEDRTWIIPAIVVIASMMVTQPVVSFVFGVMIILLACVVFLHELMKGFGKDIMKSQTATVIIVGAGGLVLSFLYWGAQIFKWGISGIVALKGGEIGGGWGSSYALQSYPIRGWTGNILLFPPHQTMIDQAIGWGLVVTFALLAGIILIAIFWRKLLSPKAGWTHLWLLLWFAVIAYATFAPSFGMPGWGSSRMWAYLAIPVTIIATEAVFIIAGSFTKSYAYKLVIVAILAGLIVLTSAPAKIDQQTSMWVAGALWTYVNSQQGPIPIELQGYLTMKEVLPKNTRVYTMCDSDRRIIGMDMQSDPWDIEASLFRKNITNKTGDEVIAFLKEKNFEYFTLDASCVRDFGANETQVFAEGLIATQRMQQVLPGPGQQLPGFLLGKLV
jgi:hypothetical protein